MKQNTGIEDGLHPFDKNLDGSGTVTLKMK